MKNLFRKRFVYLYAMLCIIVLNSFLTPSVTLIKAKDTFILGDNEHKKFGVNVKNLSFVEFDIYKKNLKGDRYDSIKLKKDQTLSFLIEANTSLNIENKSSKTGTVSLTLSGDKNLSMNYKNQE